MIKQDDSAAPNRGLFTRLRGSFLTGLVVVAPIGLTIWLVWALVTFIDGQIMPLLPQSWRKAIDVGVPGLGVLIFVAFTIVAGQLARNLIGRSVIRLGESTVERMPVVRSIYNALKQIVETIFTQSKASFQKACLVEYPRKGIWAIAFISTDAGGEIPVRTGEPEMVSVFLPTTPNPTSGFLLFVPKIDVVLLDMTIEEAAKLVISAGLVIPPQRETEGEGPAIGPTPPNGTRVDSAAHGTPSLASGNPRQR